ncbi:helix-turn-helix transcriptional regulator [Blastococcus brunescens]|uniref:Helix-turn-helix transcriptional regulator n=1 Tax=Blastococcus brunescens TaxID=1564165 RepID=A0ABZ1B8Z5_9ACTN|nr:helix-turn-helix transcriptional regulator [Blastococcus sp. BMG 8361]WRL66591.1 helix-turn-helix transcriptional regulator [Blastococcus sp. BMG 8361]
MLLRLHQLTDREREVTQLLLTGLPISAIAERLWITPETLRGHVKAVFAKLGVNSRPQMAALLSHEPVVSPSSSMR